MIDCNVADYSSQAKVFDQVFKDFGRLDALCANAGIVDRNSAYLVKARGSDEIPPAPDMSCTDVDWKGKSSTCGVRQAMLFPGFVLFHNHPVQFADHVELPLIP